MTSHQEAFKERPPEETTALIQRLLKRHKLTVEIPQERANGDSLYSIAIHLAGFDYHVNGKGRSKDFAYASGYAELMERLQNQMLFPYVEFDPSLYGQVGFRFDPEERVFGEGRLPPLPEEFQKAQFPVQGGNAYQLWEELSRSKGSRERDVVYLPYWNVKAGSIAYLPRAFLLNLLGSNGMCAGNTREEALVQGLSEIFERHVHRRFYFEGLTPPTIPHSYIAEHAPRQFEIIEFLERKEGYRVRVKDCSLHGGCPVLATKLILDSKGSYTVSFGAFPDWRIALERCLTEAFQGQWVGDYRNASLPSGRSHSQLREDVDNYMSLMVCGKGEYPDAFHLEDGGPPFRPFQAIPQSSQKGMLRRLTEWIIGNGYNIFVRDVSFLGFPAFQIVIPGMSEIKVVTRGSWDEMVTAIPVVEYLRELDALSQPRLRDTVADMEAFLQDLLRPHLVPFARYVGMPIRDFAPWDGVPLRFVMAMIHYRLGQLSSASQTLVRLHGELRRSGHGSEAELVATIAEMIRLLAAGKSMEEARRALLRSYNLKLAGHVIRTLTQGNSISELIRAYRPDFSLPTCWDCPQCPAREHCGYLPLEGIQRRLLHTAREHRQRQESLAGVFSI